MFLFLTADKTPIYPSWCPYFSKLLALLLQSNPNQSFTLWASHQTINPEWNLFMSYFVMQVFINAIRKVRCHHTFSLLYWSSSSGFPLSDFTLHYNTSEVNTQWRLTWGFLWLNNSLESSMRTYQLLGFTRTANHGKKFCLHYHRHGDDDWYSPWFIEDGSDCHNSGDTYWPKPVFGRTKCPVLHTTF